MTRPQLDSEVRIEWEREDALTWDYVRVRTRPAGTRKRGVSFNAGERVGYAVLEADAPNCGRPGVFQRRVFWVKPHDRHAKPNGVYESHTPAEAVDPRTVGPSKRGKRPNEVK
jgi:hypothetical protein